MKKGICFVFLLLAFWSCKKKPTTSQETPATVTSSVDVNITNVVGTMPLALNTQTYINANQDTFTVSLFKYYISNIKLLRQDGSFFSEPNSYHLISEDDTISSKFSIQNVPVGEYTGIEFIIGIDSTRNCSGAQTGPLDPLMDMYWDWAQGYIFAKLQGTYNTTGGYMLHVGGFTGQWSAIVKSTPSFGGNKIQLGDAHSSKIFMKADVLEWFKTPTQIDLSAYETVAIGKKSHEIAVNYSDMFSVSAIQN
jgi:hypothetical protein